MKPEESGVILYGASNRHAVAVSTDRLWNSAAAGTFTIMERFFRRPPVIAAMVAVVSIAMMIVNYTDLIVHRRPPQTPPGTTFNAVNDAGAKITPTEPESRIKLPSLVPTPIDQSQTRK